MENFLIPVRIDSEVLLNLLLERLAVWKKDDEIEIELYATMYERRILSKTFNYLELDIKKIVDNDVFNNYLAVYKSDIGAELFNEILSEYEETGGHISEDLTNKIRKIERFKYMEFYFIEAMNDQAFLINKNLK